MADRYWVGGTGTWNSSNTTNWSATSGGTGGASVPTASDNVSFDDSSASGSFTVTVSGNVSCLNLYTNPTTLKTMTFNSGSSDSVSVYGTTASTGTTLGECITTGFNGWLNIYGNTVINGANVIKNLMIAPNVSARLNWSQTTNMNEIKISTGCSLTISQDVRVTKLNSTDSASGLRPIVYVGHSTNQNADLYITGSTDCIVGMVQVTIPYSGSDLIIEPTSSACYISLGRQTGGTYTSSFFQRMKLKPLSTGTSFSFTGYGSFQDISKVPGTPSCVVKFDPTAFGISFENFNLNGEVSAVTYIQSTVDGTRAKISKTGGGAVSTVYVEVKDMQPAPDDTWLSVNSTNAGNNWQWYFDTFTKPTSNLFFGCDI